MTLHLAAIDWGQLARDWGSLITTVVLATITAWYAWLTKQLAVSSKESANSSRIAAEASRAAAAAALSSVRLKFDVSPLYSDRFEFENPDANADPRCAGITLTSGGANVYIHRLLLNALGIPLPGDVTDFTEYWATLEPGEHLPRLMHDGERMFFYMSENDYQDAPETVSALAATVYYNLDGAGTGTPLSLEWHGRAGVDYSVPAKPTRKPPKAAPSLDLK